MPGRRHNRPTGNEQSRFRALLRDLPRDLVADVRPYRSQRDRRTFDRRHYWRLLPGWILASTNKRCSSRFLTDILWAQMCLFLAVRIQDDMMDGEGRSSVAGVLPPLFHAEASLVFSRHFGRRSPFWQEFRRALRTTYGAMARVDILQRAPEGAVPSLLRLYADSYDILHVASYAACVATGKKRWVPLIRRCGGAIAKGCQILDDIADLAEDLGGGRRTYVAHRLAHGADAGPVQVAQGLLGSDRLEELLSEARSHMEKGRDELVASGITVDDGLFGEYAASIASERLRLRRNRVGRILGVVPATGTG